jgi:uncharacterized protein (TIGR00730 family)
VSRGIGSVCVFCGARAGVRPEYVEAAREVGRLLASSGITLIFGGGHVGLMGVVGDAALAAGGRAIGVIPEHLLSTEPPRRELTELVVVDSMHTRKRVMSERSDAFVVLPGGYGTYEEMFEMLTWLQLELHAKPVGLLNVREFYSPLVSFLRHAAAEGFIRARHRELLVVESDPNRLLRRLSQRALLAMRRSRGKLERS